MPGNLQVLERMKRYAHVQHSHIRAALHGRHSAYVPAEVAFAKEAAAAAERGTNLDPTVVEPITALHLQHLDYNRDGKIEEHEVTRAIHEHSGHFSSSRQNEGDAEAAASFLADCTVADARCTDNVTVVVVVLERRDAPELPAEAAAAPEPEAGQPP